MDKKNLMIDMDDVIFEGGFLSLINEFTGKSYITDDFTNYFMQEVIPKDKLADWQDFFEKSNMYTNAHFIDDAFEVIEKLNNVYNIYIVSSYIYPAKFSISAKLLYDKFNYLQEKLPFIPAYNYVFCGKKDIIDCDIKIDDRLNNLTGNKHTKTKLLFTAYHNKDITKEELNENKVQRVSGWNEIEKLLL